MSKNKILLKIATKSNPNSVAGAIVGYLKENEEHEIQIQVIGAGALNQAIKSIIIARGYIVPKGNDLVVVPAFVETNIDDDERTGIRLFVREV